MTQAETSRGPGRPKLFDELELLDRVSSIDDLVRVREALERNGEGLTAKNAVAWLIAIKGGDPSGGASRQSARIYRAALARLPRDPLGTPTGARRRRGQRGSAELVMVGAVAGAGAMALTMGPIGLALAVRAIADNAQDAPEPLSELLAA